MRTRKNGKTQKKTRTAKKRRKKKKEKKAKPYGRSKPKHDTTHHKTEKPQTEPTPAQPEWPTAVDPHSCCEPSERPAQLFEPTFAGEFPVCGYTFANHFAGESAEDWASKGIFQRQETHQYDGSFSHQYFKTPHRAHDLARWVRGKSPVFTTTFWRGSARGEERVCAVRSTSFPGETSGTTKETNGTSETR